MSIVIRLRSNLGVWRFNVSTSNPLTSNDLIEVLKAQSDNLEFTSELSLRQFPSTASPPPLPPGDLLPHLSNGTMIYGYVTPNSISPEKKKDGAEGIKKKVKVNKDGSIETLSYTEAVASKAWRPGMMPLRDMKKHWTLQEFTAMDSTFNFTIKGGGKAHCKGVSLDMGECNGFQSYLREGEFQYGRYGYLYGEYVEDDKVRVDFMYEPQQGIGNGGFEMIEGSEDEEDRVNSLASSLGLKKVGWIFGHPPREEGFVFNSEEVIMAAEMQLVDADGLTDTNFVTVKCTVNEEGEAIFDGFQLSKQCMEMVAEGALEEGAEPGWCQVNDTFTALVEGKESKKIDNNFMLQVVPIEQHESKKWVNKFPKRNRQGRPQCNDEMKKQLSLAGKQGYTFTQLLTDFHLLLFLSDFLDQNDMMKICESVGKERELDEGYKIIISSMAGIDAGF